jgi:hypothetical protein
VLGGPPGEREAGTMPPTQKRISQFPHRWQRCALPPHPDRPIRVHPADQSGTALRGRGGHVQTAECGRARGRNGMIILDG